MLTRIFAAASVEEQEDGYYDSYFDFYDDGGGVAAGVPAMSDERSLDHISDSSEETRSGDKNKNKVCSTSSSSRDLEFVVSSSCCLIS